MIEIKKLAKEMLDKVINRLREKGNKKSLGEIIDEEIKKYNEKINSFITDEIKKKIKESIYKEAIKTTSIKGVKISAGVVSPVKLSKMLYRNGTEVKAGVVRNVKEVEKLNKTQLALSKKLYDGYDSGDELLSVRKKLAKYMGEKFNANYAKRQIEKIKTIGLKSSYIELEKAYKKGDEKTIDKAIKTALEEKSRYYADRIAKTEIQRAYNLQKTSNFLNDKKVEYVKYVLNPTHRILDICDYYNNLDVGFGKGIVKKEDMIILPLHPHCGCTYEPFYGEVEKKDIKKDEYFKNLPESDKIKILGGRTNYEKYLNTKSIVSTLNDNKDEYKINKAKEIFAKKKDKGFKLVISKTGYGKNKVEDIRKYERDFIYNYEKMMEDNKQESVEMLLFYKELGIEIGELEYAKLIDFEQEAFENKFESAYILDTINKKIKVITGGESYVFIKDKYAKGIVTHNHPNGSPFSLGDIKFAKKNKIFEIRAFGVDNGKRYTYFIRSKNKFKDLKINDFKKKQDKFFEDLSFNSALTGKWKDELYKFQKDYFSGVNNISYGRIETKDYRK